MHSAAQPPGEGTTGHRNFKKKIMRKRLHAQKRKDVKEMKITPIGKSSSRHECVKEKQPTKSQNSLLDGTELFSKFTADIIKEDVFFIR
jgi:hypothetical protein